MESVRILHVVTKMDRAGLETLIMNYYRNIDRSKIQFDFLTHRSEKGDYDDEILSMGGRIYHTLSIHPKYFIQYLADLKRFFSQHAEYKIVHSHIDSLSTFPLMAAKKANIPIRIAHSHNTKFDYDFKLPIRFLSKWMLPIVANKYWSCSHAAARFLFGNKIYSRKQYIVLHNAIDSRQFVFCNDVRVSVRKTLALEDKFVIGHIGRFVYQKNHEFLIRIFYEVYKKCKKVVLLLVGDGDDKLKIQGLVESLGIDDAVQFLGVRSDIPELMQAMDVFLLPSRFEGLPVVAIEAQASGLPCVLSDAITREVDITGNVTFVSLAQTYEQWAKRVLDCKNKSRANMYVPMANAGYDIQTQAKWLEELYLTGE